MAIHRHRIREANASFFFPSRLESRCPPVAIKSQKITFEYLVFHRLLISRANLPRQSHCEMPFEEPRVQFLEALRNVVELATRPGLRFIERIRTDLPIGVSWPRKKEFSVSPKRHRIDKSRISSLCKTISFVINTNTHDLYFKIV